MRRPDLDTPKRINITIEGLFFQGQYGAMTEIANKNKISRTFLYQQVNKAKTNLDSLFSLNAPKILDVKMESDRQTLVLRLECKSSILSISETLGMLGYNALSVGYISERLKAYGGVVPSSVLSIQDSYVFYMSDEIFTNSQPILITIEAQSTAILKIELASDRSKETWAKHFEELKNNNFYSLGLCSDRGNGLVEGFKQANSDRHWYSDHFHEFMDLRKLLQKVEREAYASIRDEYNRYEVFNNAKSEKNIEKQIKQYEKAKEISNEKMKLYDDLLILSNLLTSSMDFFGSDSHLRSSEEVKGELNAIFSLMEELVYSPIKKVLSTLREHLEDITECYKNAQNVYGKLLRIIPEQNILDFLCLAWQHEHKSYQTKSETKRYHERESNFLLNCAEGLLQGTFQEIKDFVFHELNSMVRASSLIEMVNSLIRPYLNNCKGQITQETLNLIMFYHNHHRYKSGRRKNMAPIEILTGKALEKEWIDILLENQKLLPKTEKSKNFESVVNEIAPDFNEQTNKITEFNVLNKFANEQSSKKRVA
jgi:predicted DNA-binding protein YlxM (UPF0122 family)